MSDEVSGRKHQSSGPREVISDDKAKCSSLTPVYKSFEDDSVRTKSSKESSVYKSSEVYFEYSCDPCKSVGDNAEAHGFCTNCEEYLCSTCFRSHYRSKLSKDHALLDKDAMPRMTVKNCDACKRVGDEIEGVGYCKDCNEYLCGSCYKSHSRSKLSRHHILEKKDKMSEIPDDNVESTFAKMKISKGASGGQKTHKKYTYIRDIDIKADGDERQCYITAMTMVSKADLVLGDRYNQSLKLVDIENNIIKDVLPVSVKPVGLTTMSMDQVAVVLHQQCQIQIVSTCGGLSVVRIVKTNGMCIDVKHINGMFYVSFDQPVRFQIIQLTGEIMKTIKPDSEVLKHCTIPRHIAVNPDASLMYVSDWKTDKVMCIDMHGNMKYLYQGEVLCSSDIIISPFGSVYLCNRRKHTVDMMTSDLKESTVILGPGDGIRYPVAMCFNEAKKHIYISSASENVSYSNGIKVYGLK